MFNTMLRRWIVVSVILVAVCVLAAPVIAAEQAQEIAARALLGEAEKLIELSHAQDALLILDKVQTEYPGTEAAAYAEFRRAEALSHYDIDGALTCARGVVQKNPGTLLACWAQCVVGEMLIAKKQSAQGVAELLKVADMLPSQNDLGPLERAGNALSCYIGSHSDGLRMLGMMDANLRTGAKILTMLASSASRAGAIDKAEALLARLETEYSEEVAAVEHARAKLEAGKVRKNMMEEPLAEVADNDYFKTRLALMDDYSAAENSILLARNCARRGNVAEAVTVLEEARQNFAGTQKDAQILYELGEALHLQGRLADALPLYEKIADEMPASGYVGPALYSAGAYSQNDLPTAIRLLTRLAEGGYDLRWRGLAYRHLGGLYKSIDSAKAVDCYQQSIGILKQCLVEQKADIREDWRELLQIDIDQMELEVAMLQAQGQEVGQ